MQSNTERADQIDNGTDEKPQTPARSAVDGATPFLGVLPRMCFFTTRPSDGVTSTAQLLRSAVNTSE